MAIPSPQLARWGREPHGEDRSRELRGQRALSPGAGLLPAQKPLERQEECSLWLPHGQSRAVANNTGCQGGKIQLGGDVGPGTEQDQRVCKAVFAQSLKTA